MGALSGLRIIEMAGIGPAPFCGMLLADMGAEVLQVDRLAAPTSAYRCHPDSICSTEISVRSQSTSSLLRAAKPYCVSSPAPTRLSRDFGRA